MTRRIAAGPLGRTIELLMHLYPLNMGYSRIQYSPVIRALCRSLRDRSTARLRGGLSVRVLPRDDNAFELVLFGASEPVVGKICRGLLRPGDCFLDVGANYGSVGLLACRAVGPGGVVHLFEPNPTLCACIRATLEQDPGCPVHLHPVALSDADGPITLAIEPGHTGSGSIARAGDRWDSMEVRCKDIGVYLDRFLDGRPIGAKVDVEGAEPRILPWFFRDRRVRFVCFEAGLIDRWDDIWEHAVRGGYQLLGPQRHPWRIRLRRIGSPDECRRYKDLLAVRLPPLGDGELLSLESLSRRLGRAGPWAGRG